MVLGAQHAALFCTVALLAVTAYFFFGSVPLLVLKHDNSMDARFIRSFYVIYYRVAIFAALATTVSYVLAARPVFACGAAGIALLAWVVRGRFIPRMEQLAPQIQPQDAATIAAFRQIHKTAILINVVQLSVVVTGLRFF